MWYNKFKLIMSALGILALTSLIVLAWVVLSVTPGGLITGLFYLMIAALSFSIWTILGFYLRSFFGQRELQDRYLRLACRQGLWFTAILLISMLLASHNMFSWINALFLVFVFVFLEAYLLTKN